MNHRLKTTALFLCLLCFPNFLQGQRDGGGKGGRNDRKDGNDNGDKDRQKGVDDDDEDRRRHNGQIKSGGGNDGGDRPELCFGNATKHVKRILNICKCDVYERFKNFNEPDLSMIFKAVGKLTNFKPQEVASGQKKKPCKPGGPILEMLYKIQNYGFYQVKTCFWTRLELIVDGKAKWQNLENVLQYFHLPDEKKEDIKKIIEDCEKENEGNEEEEDKSEEIKFDFDPRKFSFANLPDLLEVIFKAAEKAKRGGMDKSDYKVGKCVKENLDKMCGDFKTGGQEFDFEKFKENFKMLLGGFGNQKTPGGHEGKGEYGGQRGQEGHGGGGGRGGGFGR